MCSFTFLSSHLSHLSRERSIARVLSLLFPSYFLVYTVLAPLSPPSNNFHLFLLWSNPSPSFFPSLFFLFSRLRPVYFANFMRPRIILHVIYTSTFWVIHNLFVFPLSYLTPPTVKFILSCLPQDNFFRCIKDIVLYTLPWMARVRVRLKHASPVTRWSGLTVSSFHCAFFTFPRSPWFSHLRSSSEPSDFQLLTAARHPDVYFFFRSSHTRFTGSRVVRRPLLPGR